MPGQLIVTFKERLARRAGCLQLKRLTLHEGRAIHELRADGAVLRSFHQIPDVMDPSISEMWQPDLREGATFGHLECIAEAQTLVFLIHRSEARCPPALWSQSRHHWAFP